MNVITQYKMVKTELKMNTNLHVRGLHYESVSKADIIELSESILSY